MTDEGQPGTSGTTGRQPGNTGPPTLQPHGDIDEASGTQVTGTLPLRLPPFWPKNPQVWFTQVEAHFHLRKITTQISRFYHVVASLPPQVADEIDDVLSQTPSDNAYDHLKSVLLTRTMATERSRIQQLLTAQELGDRRPSQLLHQMRQLLGSHNHDGHDAILRELFLQKLPEGMRMILAAADDMSLDRLAILADRTADYSAPAVRAVTTPASQSWETAAAKIESKIEQLAAAIAAFGPAQDRPDRSRPRSSSRGRSPSRRTTNSGGRSICWYHRTFGDQARRCTHPCSWTGNAEARH